MQHLPDDVGHETHSPGGDVFGDVEVSVRAGTRLRMLVGDEGLVACHHHQAVAAHPGYTAAAYAADGTLEAMEAAGDRFEVAVQWHPETRADAGLFSGLVAAAVGTSDAPRSRLEPECTLRPGLALTRAGRPSDRPGRTLRSKRT